MALIAGLRSRDKIRWRNSVAYLGMTCVVLMGVRVFRLLR